MRTVLGKDPEHQYHGMPAASQEVFNKLMRHHGAGEARAYDEAGRQELQDRLDFLRGQRRPSRVPDAVRRAREAQEAPASDKTGNVGPPPRQRSPEREEGHRIALDKVKQAKEALDDQPPTGQ